MFQYNGAPPYTTTYYGGVAYMTPTPAFRCTQPVSSGWRRSSSSSSSEEFAAPSNIGNGRFKPFVPQSSASNHTPSTFPSDSAGRSTPGAAARPQTAVTGGAPGSAAPVGTGTGTRPVSCITHLRAVCGSNTAKINVAIGAGDTVRLAQLKTDTKEKLRAGGTAMQSQKYQRNLNRIDAFLSSANAAQGSR